METSEQLTELLVSVKALTNELKRTNDLLLKHDATLYGAHGADGLVVDVTLIKNAIGFSDYVTINDRVRTLERYTRAVFWVLMVLSGLWIAQSWNWFWTTLTHAGLTR